MDWIFGGGASLTKYQKIKSKKVKKSLKLFPPSIVTSETPIVEDSEIWSVHNNTKNYLVRNGEITKYASGNDYKNQLKGDAANIDVKLPSELIRTIFDPIDQKLLRIYQEVKNL